MNIGNTYAQIQQFDDEFNLERTVTYLAEAYNVPKVVFNTPEEKQQILDERQAQMEQQQLVENANKIGSGMKNLVEAQNLQENGAV